MWPVSIWSNTKIFIIIILIIIVIVIFCIGMTLPYTHPTQMAISEICGPIKPLRCKPDCSFRLMLMLMLMLLLMMMMLMMVMVMVMTKINDTSYQVDGELVYLAARLALFRMMTMSAFIITDVYAHDNDGDLVEIMTMLTTMMMTMKMMTMMSVIIMMMMMMTMSADLGIPHCQPANCFGHQLHQ